MSEGLRVPGLPEGLEIVRIAEQSGLIPDGEYSFPNFAGSEEHGDTIVRALPGYQIRHDIRENKTVVVKVGAPKELHVVLRVRGDRDRALVKRAMDDLSRSGVEVVDVVDPPIEGKVCDPGFTTAIKEQAEKRKESDRRSRFEAYGPAEGVER